MKKITLLVSALALTSTIFGQSQRLVLSEEFTQASCPPCAAQNPGYNTLLAANTSKITSIKYQTVWPGVDPMNAQNQTDVATRVTYYSVNGVPDAPMDGHELADLTGAGYYVGAPHNYVQTRIDSAYAVPSPFTIALSHTFSADFSTVTINMTITCSQAITGSLVAQIGLVEKQIHFASAPGTNGETDFYNVMKKMYPTAAGTTLASTWTVGQTQTITITAAAVPSYVYDLNQLAVVAWVQDNTTKDIKQAGYDAPTVLPVSNLDAGISAITNLSAIQCATTITPSVTVKNYSPTTMTSCTINYQLDGGTVMTQAWTGSLTTGTTAAAALPTMTVTVGTHVLKSWTSNPNSGNDYYIINNSSSKTFNIIGTAALAPVSEGFLSATFPPANWVVDDPDGNYPWSRSGTVGGWGVAPANSAFANFYNDPSGNIEYLYVKPTDLTSTLAHAVLTFDVAYAQYTTENDKLEVQASDDCGVTWTTPYSKQGATLATAPATGSGSPAFVPTATQWRNEQVDLTTPYLHQPNVLVRFKATSAYGNLCYVDNVNLFTSASAAGINEVTANATSLEVYPNPISDNATVEFNLASSTNVTVSMYNLLGEVVYSNVLGQMNEGNHSVKLDAQKLNAGIYFVTLTVADGKITKKVSINK